MSSQLLSKEDILQHKYTKYGGEEVFNRPMVEKAMDEYAKQEAIGFAEWKLLNRVQNGQSGKWYIPTLKNNKGEIVGVDMAMTSKELYNFWANNLYQQSKQP